MRVFLGVVICTVFLSACSGSNGRGIQVSNRNNFQPAPDPEALTVDLITHYDEDGDQHRLISLWLNNESSGFQWSDYLGDRFLVSLDGQTSSAFDLQLDSSEDAYRLEYDSDSRFFESVHGNIVKLYSANHSPLAGQSVRIPEALSYFPQSIDPLRYRILENCEYPGASLNYSTLYWVGRSDLPFSLEFFEPSNQSFTTGPIDIADNGSGTALPIEVLQRIFTSSEREQADRDQGRLSRLATGRLVRSSGKQSLRVNAPRDLKVLVRVIDLTDYYLEYQGGCEP